mgnify:CR=1 FL=1
MIFNLSCSIVLSTRSDGYKHFLPVTPNVTIEAMHDDQSMHQDHLTERTASISSPLFSGNIVVAPNLFSLLSAQLLLSLTTERGLMKLLTLAIDLLQRAQRFEVVSPLYQIITPVLQRDRRYGRLAAAHADLNGCYNKIMQFNTNNKRRLGTFFRVGFYGNPFRELAGAEFIYKEPNVTPLSEISLRLQALYSVRFGADNVNLITDSNKVDPAALDNNKAHIQITFVEPYFPSEERARRLNYFEQNHNISWFMFETPFTKRGGARGRVNEQFKRKTMLKVEGGFCFPYVKKRLLVVERTREVMEPIDVAIEEMSKKVGDIRAAVNANPPDIVLLQMQLQGSVSMQVNAGPMEFASEFLDTKNLYAFDRVQVTTCREKEAGGGRKEERRKEGRKEGRKGKREEMERKSQTGGWV